MHIFCTTEPGPKSPSMQSINAVQDRAASGALAFCPHTENTHVPTPPPSLTTSASLICTTSTSLLSSRLSSALMTLFSVSSAGGELGTSESRCVPRCFCVFGFDWACVCFIGGEVLGDVVLFVAFDVAADEDDVEAVTSASSACGAVDGLRFRSSDEPDGGAGKFDFRSTASTVRSKRR